MTVKSRRWLAEPRLLRLGAVCGVPVLYALWVRPRLLAWGASRDEASGVYPGDELISGPAHCSTMATTLPAPPERIWPWLVQMGYDRAGWYSWDKLDHGGKPSMDRIVPEWQNLHEGQRVNSMAHGRNWMTVAVLEPNRTLVLRTIYQVPSFRTVDPRSGPLPPGRMDAIWGFHLRPLPGGGTRLVIRKRGRGPRAVTWPVDLLYDPLHWIMQTRQFHNLRTRVGAQACSGPGERGSDARVQRPVRAGREDKEAAMTAKTPHKEAGAGVKTKRMTRAVPAHDGSRQGARLLKIRDVSLFADIIGQGYPLLLMHGGPSLDHWSLTPFRQLADQFTVIFYDHRCNGRSAGAPVSSMTFENLTADAEALREELGVERWAVLGHSFGGQVALEYALRYPGSLSHLVLLDTGGEARWAQQNAAKVLARRGYSPKKVELVRRWFNGEFTPHEYVRMAMRIGPAYYHHPSLWLTAREEFQGGWRTRYRPQALIFAGRHLLKGWTVMDRLGEITVPTLVMAGSDDFVFPPECQRELAASIPHAYLQIIDRAGHSPHSEQTAEVMAGVRHFLSAETPAA